MDVPLYRTKTKWRAGYSIQVVVVRLLLIHTWLLFMACPCVSNLYIYIFGLVYYIMCLTYLYIWLKDLCQLTNHIVRNNTCCLEWDLRRLKNRIERDPVSMCTMATYQISSPESFCFANSDKCPKWIRRFERFRQALGLASKDKESQVNTLFYTMGD